MAKSVAFCCLLLMFVAVFMDAAFSLEQPVEVPPSPSPESAADSPPVPSPTPFPHAPASSPAESPLKSPPAPPRSDLTPCPSPARVPSPSPAPAPSLTADSDFRNSIANGGGGETETSKGGMNGGKKAGIAVGVIAAACFVGVGGIVYKKRQDNIRRSQFGNAARSSFL
ncbi:lysine-rich arabinogalactan protein 18-like [Cucurbita moschata]|uniref:Lysine-rich arabinogalactan protein 18-like n=1 Tax=Cucurbita moschata TaxID=3662 RepID=A0A6J1H149_CUCMO|nr:lysine-rich arabinogalactan protein 18-like [Cucurbita moschata]